MMDKREHTIQQALQRNSIELAKCRQYVDDNSTAIQNLDVFVQKLMLDVLVPIGNKAFMPGQLIHTNEVLVAHNQGYFSKCSSHKAKELCALRIKRTEEFIKKLETEAELWENKLNKPYADGAIASGEEREIIESYDEVNENLWMEHHKLRVKEAKLKEKQEREKIYESLDACSKERKTDDEIFEMLEKAELLEELEGELDKLKIDEFVNDEDLLHNLISGKIKLPPEKHRIAHTPSTDKSKDVIFVNNHKPRTNENHINADIDENNKSIEANIDEDHDDDEPEIRMIKEQAKYLSAKDQVGFYDYQIEIVQQKIKKLTLKTTNEMHEKIRLLIVLEHLQELMDLAEDAVIINNENTNKLSNMEIVDNQALNNEFKRRISFASKDQTLEFRKDESVTQMLAKSDSVKKDSIKESIENKILNNSEILSIQNFNLVDETLKSSTNEMNTLHISFKHSSDNDCSDIKINDNEDCTLYTPSNIYDKYLSYINRDNKNCKSSIGCINSYRGEEELKVPISKECDRKLVFENTKLEFDNPTIKTKPILRNKLVVGTEENHCTIIGDTTNNNNYKEFSESTINTDDDMSVYNKVVSDIVEKSLSNPNPLKKDNFIDMHTSKKRISRFKQKRQEVNK